MARLSDQDREGVLTYIRDACGVRSPSTVLKRARDLQQFVNWCTSKDKQRPISEKDLLDFLRSCGAEGRSKFIGKNLVHAIKFFKFVMGGNIEVEEIDAGTNDSR